MRLYTVESNISSTVKIETVGVVILVSFDRNTQVLRVPDNTKSAMGL